MMEGGMEDSTMAIDELETRFSPASSAEVVYHATVHDIPSGDRPRERLQQHGADALSTADLLAIILRTGTTRDKRPSHGR